MAEYQPIENGRSYPILHARPVDGDTLDVTLDLGFGITVRRRVRMYGIDAPETRTRDEEEKRFGTMTKDKLTWWCSQRATRRELRCPEPCSDKYGRVLGELWWSHDDGACTNINKWLCDQALAVPYRGQARQTVQHLHLENRKRLLQHPEGPIDDTPSST